MTDDLDLDLTAPAMPAKIKLTPEQREALGKLSRIKVSPAGDNTHPAPLDRQLERQSEPLGTALFDA